VNRHLNDRVDLKCSSLFGRLFETDATLKAAAKYDVPFSPHDGCIARTLLSPDVRLSGCLSVHFSEILNDTKHRAASQRQLSLYAMSLNICVLFGPRNLRPPRSHLQTVRSDTNHRPQGIVCDVLTSLLFT